MFREIFLRNSFIPENEGHYKHTSLGKLKIDTAGMFDKNTHYSKSAI